jgi:hypothetical protein
MNSNNRAVWYWIGGTFSERLIALAGRVRCRHYSRIPVNVTYQCLCRVQPSKCHHQNSALMQYAAYPTSLRSFITTKPFTSRRFLLCSTGRADISSEPSEQNILSPLLEVYCSSLFALLLFLTFSLFLQDSKFYSVIKTDLWNSIRNRTVSCLGFIS